MFQVRITLEYILSKVCLIRMNCTKSARGPLFLDLEYKWHPSMGTAKSFQDAITLPAPEMVKNIAYPGIFYRSVKNCMWLCICAWN